MLRSAICRFCLWFRSGIRVLRSTICCRCLWFRNGAPVLRNTIYCQYFYLRNGVPWLRSMTCCRWWFRLGDLILPSPFRIICALISYSLVSFELFYHVQISKSWSNGLLSVLKSKKFFRVLRSFCSNSLVSFEFLEFSSLLHIFNFYNFFRNSSIYFERFLGCSQIPSRLEMICYFCSNSLSCENSFAIFSKNM